MRFLSVVILLVFGGFAFAPIGVPLSAFSSADLSKIPPSLIAAGRFSRLDFYAAKLAVSEYVEASGPKQPQPETLLTYARGRIFSGKDQMVAFALKRAFVVSGVQGWENASTQCFKKEAEDLSLSDAAVLVLHMRSPTKEWNEQSEELMERRNAFLRGMAANGFTTGDEASAAASSTLVYCTREL